jgi:hypothetical protein
MIYYIIFFTCCKLNYLINRWRKIIQIMSKWINGWCLFVVINFPVNRIVANRLNASGIN